MSSQIFYGVDAKTLQYEEHAKSVCTDQINIQDVLENGLFKKKLDQNCILINLEKDEERYHNTINEFKKISVKNFVHVKGTDGKNKEALEQDLSMILAFLKDHNKKIKKTKVTINEFSEPSDKNIFIQGGPLGCYCSHVRAMIYGYLNFKDYTIIMEDDIAITNTKNIEQYLKCIPDDWDIICLNSAPKNIAYSEPYYKFTDAFHSGHFYIIRNRCLPFLFKNVYPIYDQIDVLVSNCVGKLNIYNIPETVFQKNISTNTQNNLFVIFNSPHYKVLRDELAKIESLSNFFANHILPNNKKRNKTIVSNLMYDVLYDFILRSDLESIKHANKETFDFDATRYQNLSEYHELVASVDKFISCCRKGIKQKTQAIGLVNTMLFTLHNFVLHNCIDDQLKEVCKAYGFGASSQTYILKNRYLIKQYNKKLRWVAENHDDSEEIFQREVKILKRLQNVNCVPKIIGHTQDAIKMSYEGQSLYDNFVLPTDWKKQIRLIFDIFDSKNIYYSEFKLQNILVRDNKIKFVDFGLAELDASKKNTENYAKFINNMAILEKKLKSVKSKKRRQQLIADFKPI